MPNRSDGGRSKAPTHLGGGVGTMPKLEPSILGVNRRAFRQLDNAPNGDR